MTDSAEQPHRSLLPDYIERISALQRSTQELQAEMNQIRRDARADGLNMEAVNILSIVVSKSSHDGGLSMLQDVVKYAYEMGINLDSVTVETNPKASESDSTFRHEAASVSQFKASDTSIDERLAFLFQLGLGLGVAWAFIALLN